MAEYTGFGTTPETLLGDLPAGILNLAQAGFLERFLEIGLNSVLGYRRLAQREGIPVGIGETLTKSKFGRKQPVVRPINPSQLSALDSGVIPTDAPTEQYTFTLAYYSDTVDVNLLQAEALIADQLRRVSFNNGVQAAQSMDRIARVKLFAKYDTGNTFATAAYASGVTSIHVDDIRGFQYILSNGRPTGVSAATPLSAVHYSAANGAVVQTLTITAATPDAINVSIYPAADGQNSDGISGTLTVNATSNAITAGDALVAAGSANILRPNAKVTTAALAPADLLSAGTIFDAVTVLRNNAVPMMPDGTYWATLSNTSLRQLWADQDFKVLFAGNQQSAEYRRFDVTQIFGTSFIPTTEAYVQASGLTDGSVTLNTRVERPIICGDGVLLEGDFEGMESFINRKGVRPIGDLMMVDGVAQVMRPPLGRNGTAVSLTWFWVGDFAVPTDSTATTPIIPTADGANWKRAVCIEHASI